MKIHKYPKPDKLQIDEANLELELKNYEIYLENKFNWKDLLFLIPVWAILFTSKFNNTPYFSGEILKGIYLELNKE